MLTADGLVDWGLLEEKKILERFNDLLSKNKLCFPQSSHSKKRD